MKAIRAHGRGDPESLVYENAPLPRIWPGDALIRVSASGITPAEFTWGATYQNPDAPMWRTFPSALSLARAPTASSIEPGEALSGPPFHAVIDCSAGSGASTWFAGVDLR